MAANEGGAAHTGAGGAPRDETAEDVAGWRVSQRPHLRKATFPPSLWLANLRDDHHSQVAIIQCNDEPTSEVPQQVPCQSSTLPVFRRQHG